MVSCVKPFYKTLFGLEGRTAVVTGGAGILGRVFCACLAEMGARVAVCDLKEAEADQAAREISGEYQTPVLGIGCDVSDPSSVRGMMERVLKSFEEVHILFNNAATKTDDLNAFLEPVETYRPEVWRKAMAVNIDGMFYVAQAVGKQMIAQGGGGSIVQTASIYGLLAPDQRIYPGSFYLGRELHTPAVYTTSKAAVIGLTRHLAALWAPRGIRVNALVPGGVESGQNDTFKRQYSERVPLGRMARREELVGPALFLASDASGYVTGQTIVVDGGLSVW